MTEDVREEGLSEDRYGHRSGASTEPRLRRAICAVVQPGVVVAGRCSGSRAGV